MRRCAGLHYATPFSFIRATAKGVKSIFDDWESSIWSASATDDAVESCNPILKWPVETKTFSQPDTRPMNGNPSNVAGRNPAHALTRFCSVNCGIKLSANRCNALI